MTRYDLWKEALANATSRSEVEAIVAHCTESLAAGDKLGWSKAARNMLFEPDIRIAAVTLVQESEVFLGEPEVATVLHEVAQIFVAAAKRVAELDKR